MASESRGIAVLSELTYIVCIYMIRLVSLLIQRSESFIQTAQETPIQVCRFPCEVRHEVSVSQLRASPKNVAFFKVYARVQICTLTSYFPSFNHLMLFVRRKSKEYSHEPPLSEERILTVNKIGIAEIK